MTWYLAGEDLTLAFDFEVDGEFVAPSAAYLTLRDHAGSILSSGTELTVTGTRASFTIDAADLTVASGHDYENRFIWVTFQHEGRDHYLDHTFRIHNFIPMTVKPRQVRETLGLDWSELKDGEIDLPGVYFQLKEEFGTDFTNSLTGSSSLKTNRIIVLKAALNLMPSLLLRVASKMTAEEQTFQRLSEIDLLTLRVDLEAELNSLLETVTDIEPLTFTIFTKVTPVDPVTGA